ncbi:YycH family regulatory protein [Agrilactobacillus fermenti]|uniref:YycH family regulatory protein n=1 Tax=Agrilactobacillus fermenti TaxID=2586909 RepID=UPI001E5ECD8F|nr:two-component system activity regulator YycH [Agrilactobacillus fermenti]MCD2255615.1 hypothetical protein [Agrilactobacillus fermenti]
MGIKLSDVLLKVTLFVTIAVSILFSFLIWTNNARYERNTDPKLSNSQSTMRSNKALADIYLPTRILARKEQQGYMVYNRTANPVLSFQKELSSWRIQHISQAKTYNDDDYLKLINGKNRIQLTYPDSITWRLLREVYGFKGETSKQDFKLSRIIFMTKNTKKVYLADDSSKRVYAVSLVNNGIKKLDQLLTHADLRLPVDEQLFNNKITLFYTHSVNMMPYSYLISKENINNYISTLLSNDDDGSIEARENGPVTTYYRGLYKKLSTDASTDQIQYEDYTDIAAIGSTTRLLESGFDRLSNVGNNLANARYFSLDTKTQTITYRSYVEGFPIFQQSDFGVASVQINQNGEILRFSSRSLQVPVPADEKQVKVPATKDVLAQLTAAGQDISTIKDIRLGYRWVQKTSDQQVIDLTPTYYVHVDGTWKDYHDLLQQ